MWPNYYDTNYLMPCSTLTKTEAQYDSIYKSKFCFWVFLEVTQMVTSATAAMSKNKGYCVTLSPELSLSCRRKMEGLISDQVVFNKKLYIL